MNKVRIQIVNLNIPTNIFESEVVFGTDTHYSDAKGLVMAEAEKMVDKWLDRCAELKPQKPEEAYRLIY